MSSLFEVGSPAAVFTAIAAGTAVKYIAGVFLRKQKEYKLVGEVGAIWIFPVKSLRGISVKEAEIGRLGLEWNGVGDRQWVVTNAEGNFMCQRRYPKMVLIEPVLKGQQIELHAPGMDPICFPINPKLTPSNLSKATVHGETVASLDVGDEVGAWLSHYFGMEGIRLHYSEPSLEKRDASNTLKRWGNPAVKGDFCAFADFCSYLVLSEDSVNFLNTMLEKPVPVSNFRPNIVVCGCGAFTEDSWSSMKIGESRIRALDPCTRCVMPTVDQTTGIKDKDGEPFATLKKFRVKEPYGLKPLLGVNYTYSNAGTIRVGDPIYALES